MKFQRLATFALLSLFAACGRDATRAAAAIAGHWSQETGSDAEGMTIEFDGASDKLMVHTAPAADGSHDHLSGTYEFDTAANTLTVRCGLLGVGKGDVWNGKLDGDHLTVKSGTGELRFHRGDDPHGHEHK